MTYPQVSHTAATGDERRRPVEPVVPADRGSGARLLGRRRHLPGQRRAARRGRGRRQRVRLLRRPALRQRAAALRPPADRLRQGPGAALPDDARAPRRAPLRLGHPRPAGRARGDAPARHEDDRGDPRPRHREVQRRVPQVRLRVHLGVARLRHPPGPLGRLRQRLQDPRPPLHGERHVGLQAAPRQGAGLRGLPRAALLLERRDAAVQPRAADGRGRLPAARRPGRDRRPAADERTGRGRARPGLDDDPVDARGQPRGDGRPRHRLRRRRVGLHRYARSGTCSPRPAWRRTRRSSATSPERRRSGSTGADLLESTYTPPMSYYLGHERAFRVVEADFVTTEDGTGLVHTAGAFGEEDKVVTDREGIEPVVPVAKDGTFTAAGRRLRRPARLRGQPRDHRPPQGDDHAAPARRVGHRRAPCCCAASPTSTPTRTAGAAASR